MRILRPRSPKLVNVKGKLRPKVGYAQMQMLRLIDSLGKGEEPPAGVLTATGVLREHIANDMIPLNYVTATVHRAGVTDYMLTKHGRDALKNGIVMDPPKTQKRTLMQRQRERAKTKAATETHTAKTKNKGMARLRSGRSHHTAAA